MNNAESQITPKNRLDVVDTAILRQKEIQALKWLGLLFFIALVYEGWEPLMARLSMPDYPVPELNRDMRKTFPDKRIHRLTQVLRSIQQTFPLIRDALKMPIEDLDWLKDQNYSRGGVASLNARLETNIGGLWRLFHSPMWEDQKPFGLAVAEIQTIYKLLRSMPPDEQDIPPLIIGPRRIDGQERAGRDLFQFVIPEKR